MKRQISQWILGQFSVNFLTLFTNSTCAGNCQWCRTWLISRCWVTALRRLLRRIRKTCEVVVVASPKPIVFQRHLVSIHAWPLRNFRSLTWAFFSQLRWRHMRPRAPQWPCPRKATTVRPPTPLSIITTTGAKARSHTSKPDIASIKSKLVFLRQKTTIDLYINRIA